MDTKFDSIIRSTAKMSAAAEQSDYGISAEVHIEGTSVTKMTDGRVMLADVEVAAFNVWKDGKLSIAFNVADKDTRVDILAEIHAFIEAVSAKVNVEPISL